jgi:hypothetical protein
MFLKLVYYSNFGKIYDNKIVLYNYKKIIKQEAIMTIEEITNETKNILIENNLIQHGNFFNDVDIEINANIQIGHLANVNDTFKKLADIENSPIADDGYSGIGIYELDTAGQLKFILDMNHLSENENIIKSFAINEGVSENDD